MMVKVIVQAMEVVLPPSTRCSYRCDAPTDCPSPPILLATEHISLPFPVATERLIFRDTH